MWCLFPSASLPHPTDISWIVCFSVSMLYIAWKRGLPRKFAHFVQFCLIKECSFNLLCVLDLPNSQFELAASQLKSIVTRYQPTNTSPFNISPALWLRCQRIPLAPRHRHSQRCIQWKWVLQKPAGPPANGTGQREAEVSRRLSGNFWLVKGLGSVVLPWSRNRKESWTWTNLNICGDGGHRPVCRSIILNHIFSMQNYKKWWLNKWQRRQKRMKRKKKTNKWMITTFSACPF